MVALQAFDGAPRNGNVLDGRVTPIQPSNVDGRQILACARQAINGTDLVEGLAKSDAIDRMVLPGIPGIRELQRRFIRQCSKRLTCSHDVDVRAMFLPYVGIDSCSGQVTRRSLRKRQRSLDNFERARKSII